MLLTVDQESLLGRLHSRLSFPCNTQNHSIFNSNSLSEKPSERSLISDRSPKCTRLHVLKPLLSVRDEEIIDCMCISVYFPNSTVKPKMLVIQFQSRAKIRAKRESSFLITEQVWPQCDILTHNCESVYQI